MSKDYPNDLRYTNEHEWVRVNGKIATVGITAYAVEQLGDITMIDLPKEGEKFAREAQLASVESVKAVSDIYAPISGTVLKVNAPLADSPEMLNEDCYDEGWIVELEISNPKEIEGLMTSAEYEKYIRDSAH
ncbi:MAG TPA: glycine cleavage system protein GcvH [Pseudomonadota bacterium]|nr:glycine cleavage system protein GcvH [Pseudomonadota bacterium]